MLRPLPVLVGVLAVVVLGAGVSTAVVRSGNETSSPTVSTTTVETTTTTLLPVTSTGPTATVARPTTTRVTTPRATTAPTTRPSTTSAPITSAPTTTRPALTRAAATQGLCADIEASVRLVVGGNTVGGGLRLLRAVNTYGDAADPSVVAPARRMLSAGLNGDLDASAVATQEAATACARLGYPVNLPGPIQCIQAPCP
ncbi:MAG: hypothetical protein ACR2KK_18745 [Acidimicrobiales bacterium]